jgi:hypothetical protein
MSQKASKKGKVQLLRLQANKNRREQLVVFNGHVTLALQHGVDAKVPAEEDSNFEPPVFLLFDWEAFPRELRQQYYDRLKSDFPGDFIYISASDDFASLQSASPLARVHLLLLPVDSDVCTFTSSSPP